MSLSFKLSHTKFLVTNHSTFSLKPRPLTNQIPQLPSCGYQRFASCQAPLHHSRTIDGFHPAPNPTLNLARDGPGGLGRAVHVRIAALWGHPSRGRRQGRWQTWWGRCQRCLGLQLRLPHTSPWLRCLRIQQRNRQLLLHGVASGLLAIEFCACVLFTSYICQELTSTFIHG